MKYAIRFFKDRYQADDFVQSFGTKTGFKVIDYGKYKKYFFVKYTKAVNRANKE